MGFIAFIMLLNGGMLPTYMVVRSLGILDTRWALLPGALSVINIIIMPQRHRIRAGVMQPRLYWRMGVEKCISIIRLCLWGAEYRILSWTS